MNIKLGFIGGGNIAHALIAGLLKAGNYSKRDISVYDIDPAKKEFYRQEGIKVCESEADLVRSVNLVFLTVRPSDLRQVLSKIASTVSSSNVLISVAAGISIDFIKRNLGRDCKVVRVMPNTASCVNSGATALSYAMPITYSELNLVKDIFESLGALEIMEEDKMNEVISVNSSSPAFVYMLIRAMITGAVNQGIPEETAKHLVIETVNGSMKMLMDDDIDLTAKINEICSPNGTTVKAVEYLEKRGFEQSVADAMLACTRRAVIIEKEADVQ